MASDSICSPTPNATSTSTDKSSPAYLKRREQVRRAQRTHRERKESYIHALESEVLQLRTKSRKVEEQNDALNLEVALLRNQAVSKQCLHHGTAWTAAWMDVDSSGGSTNAGGSVDEEWLSIPADVPAQESIDDSIFLGEVSNASVSRQGRAKYMMFLCSCHVLTLRQWCRLPEVCRRYPIRSIGRCQ
jgi:hypothetical protein